MEADLRTQLKRALAVGASRRPADGLTVLIYHRVGGGTTDELDMPVSSFEAQLDVLSDHRVLSLDDALDELEAGDASPKVSLTFDDGFGDLYSYARPLLKERTVPFTVYVASSFVGGRLRWEGSTAKSAPASALTWNELEDLLDSGLCTLGNHTHTHALPAALTAAELDRCTEELTRRLGVTPRHFAYTWGLPVPAAEPWLRDRFRSAVTGIVGRNLPGADLLRLRRVPVRRTDPIEFFRAKLTGRLLPERAYAGTVRLAKGIRRG